MALLFHNDPEATAKKQDFLLLEMLKKCHVVAFQYVPRIILSFCLRCSLVSGAKYGQQCSSSNHTTYFQYEESAEQEGVGRVCFSTQVTCRGGTGGHIPPEIGHCQLLWVVATRHLAPHLLPPLLASAGSPCLPLANPHPHHCCHHPSLGRHQSFMLLNNSLGITAKMIQLQPVRVWLLAGRSLCVL